MSFSSQLEMVLSNPSPRLRAFCRLIEPCNSQKTLQILAQKSAALTRKHFGRTMRLFAPLYLSNECINSCAYCGFSRENPIARVTLEIEQLAIEAQHLASQGFRNILLVAGEHPKFVSNGYLERCVRRLAPFIPALALEVAPMETEDYLPLAAAGAEGLVVYQETYHRPTYEKVHLAGPKKDFHWRLDAPERAYVAGFRRLGIGALLGLFDWQFEAMALAAHLEHLERTCWKSQITISLPRLRPAAGNFEPTHPISDFNFIQLICAFRITFPHVGIVLSTREPIALRDALAPIGITMMSAGSHTEPGGYTGQGKESLHLTLRGRTLPLSTSLSNATEQFEISDHRTPFDVATRLQQLGLEPIWKDWDSAILSRTK